jgi:hypothetical protein
MQNTLFDAELSVHKFGSHLLHVPSLKNWADSKGFHFPKTNPPIEDYEFVQVEALLVAIMRVVHSSMTPEDAFREVQNDSKLNGHELAQHSSITARWLIGADVHLQWRKEISAAINKQELKLLKRGSLLPVTSEDLEVLLSSMPHIQTGAIETLQTESKVDDIETNANDAGNGDYKKASEKLLNTSKHTLNGNHSRDTDLTTEILRSISNAQDPNSVTSVWTALRDIALNGEGLFTGEVTNEGLHYQKSSGNVAAILNKKALSKRLNRIKKKSTTKSR